MQQSKQQSMQKQSANLPSTLPKILMVDDKPENLLALERLLRSQPVQLFPVTSGNEALRLTLHHDFALALLDIQMPDMDGYELAELLRQEERTAKMPFIFISAIYTDHINVFQGYEKGAFSYIVKPFEPSILLNKVKLFIDMYEHEQQLHRRSAELERANRELEAFSYSVSHDLRAPLRSIHGFAGILAEEHTQQLDEEGRELLGRITQAAARMSNLIDAMLSLSSLNAADMTLEPVDVSALAQEVVADLELQIAASPDIHVQPAMQATGDKRLLRIVFDNLLGNAWKFTREAEMPQVAVGMMPDARTYFVRDNGAGFDMRYADKLFQPFQRLHENDRFPGTGIGLATVQRIIDKHGGHIWVEAEPGRGATFFFTLQGS